MPRKKRCKVFVSYSRHDEALVKPLAQLLGVASDQAVFFDLDSVNPGELWESQIDDAVRAAPVFILCWCCQCVNSRFIQHEIELALQDPKKQLVPVRLCSLPLPEALAKRQWINLNGQVSHLCNHSQDQAGHPQAEAQPTAMFPTGHLASPPQLLQRRFGGWPMLATVSAILLSVVIVFRLFSSRATSYPPVKGDPSNEAYCQYLEGPRAGQRDSSYSTSPNDPQKCIDAAGNEGVMVRPGNLYPPVEAEEPVRLLPIIALALLVALGVGGTRLLILRFRRTEAQTIADRAVSYFSQLH